MIHHNLFLLTGQDWGRKESRTMLNENHSPLITLNFILRVECDKQEFYRLPHCFPRIRHILPTPPGAKYANPARITVAMQQKAKNWEVCYCWCFILVSFLFFSIKHLAMIKVVLCLFGPVKSAFIYLPHILINRKPSMTMYKERKNTIYTQQRDFPSYHCGSAVNDSDQDP